MDPFERSLHERLARREPSQDFAARVMAQVHAAADEPRETIAPRRRPALFFGWRWATAGALAAVMAGVVVVRDQQARSRRVAAERAEAELAETLQLAGFTIHEARERVWGSLDASTEEKGDTR